MKSMTLAGMLIALLFAGCNKNTDADKGICNAFFDFTKTVTASPVSVSDGINSIVTSYAPNSCYTFSHTEIKQITGNIFEISSLGKVTCGATICADVLIGAQDTAHVATSMPGTYILRFFNGNLLFKSDTVQVN
jgi:hypothetical protein